MRSVQFLVVAGLVASVCLPALGSGIPDFYSHVESVDWVVADLDATIRGWKELGFAVSAIEELDVRIVGGPQRSGTFRVRISRGCLAGFNVTWIQPREGRSLYREFLDRRGDGVISINHRPPDRQALAAEVARLEQAGVGVLGRVVPVGREAEWEMIYFDSERKGRIALALAGGAKIPFPTGDSPLFRKSQYAYVVRSLEPVSAYWAALGFPAMQVTHGPLSELVHRGNPGTFDQRLGWQRHGDVVFEWIEPLAGPTVYEESLAAHGEGFHHFGFAVSDMDVAVRFFESRGLVCSQSGAWGERGKPGSGRFAYIDTERIGGITIELLWNFREQK